MEEATVELRAAKTELATAEDKLATAEDELKTAKAKLATAEDKLANAQTEYDNHSVKRPKEITEKLKRAREDFTLCSNTVNSKEAMVVSKQNVLTNLKIDARLLSAAPAPGKFER